MPGNPISRARRERNACPPITPADAEQWADRAVEDAFDLIVDVRELDPREVYGRLVLWGRETPSRLVTACYALAAMHDPDTPAAELQARLDATPRPAQEAAA